MAADRAPSGTGHDTAEPIFPGCKRPVSECRAEDVDDPLFSVPADPVVSPADTPEERDPFADDVLERLIQSNHNYQREHGHYIVPLADRLLKARAERAALLAVGERDRQHIAQLTEALTWLAEFFRVDLTPHDPIEWHGGMKENIARCPTCVGNAALAAVLADKEDAGNG